MSQELQSPLTILRRRQVESRTGLSRSSIYEAMKEQRFPKPIQLGAKSVGWLESDISNWIADRIQDSRQALDKIVGVK